MSIRISEISQFSGERFLSNSIIIHETSRHHSTRGELPRHLASALGASGVSIVFFELDAALQETKRTSFSTDNSADSVVGSANDWAGSLLREGTGSGRVSKVERFASPSPVQVLYPIDAASAVAFSIHSPDAMYAITEGGKALLLSLLSHIAVNFRYQAISAASPVRSMPLLKTLTRAEWRVLLALDSEASEKEISATLGTSANTLHSHIKSIYRRLGVQSRLSAIAILRRAERASLIAQLQTNANGETGLSNPQGQGSSGNNPADIQRDATITLHPIREVPFRSPTFSAFAGTESRVG